MAKQTTNLVSVDTLVFEDNIRTAACLNLPKMVESIKRHGFKVNHPLVISKRVDDSLVVLCGNRRGLSLCFLRDNEPEAYKVACPTGKIPAVVHEGLTPEDEVMIRIDHSADEDREPLDQWSEFQAIRQLVLIGQDTQETIATKLGIYHTKGKNKGTPNRSYIQPRVNLSRLPRFVQNEVERYCDKPDDSPMRWSLIASLYKAYNSEMVEFPNGDGPALSDAFQKAMKPKVTELGPDTPLTGKNLTPSDARRKAQACTSAGVKIVLLAATQQGQVDLVRADAIVKGLEDDSVIVELLRGHLGGTFDEIVSEAIAAKVDVESEVVA